MRKPIVENFVFGESETDDFGEIVGVSMKQANKIISEVNQAIQKNPKKSDFVKTLSEDFTKAEVILALLAVMDND